LDTREQRIGRHQGRGAPDGRGSDPRGGRADIGTTLFAPAPRVLDWMNRRVAQRQSVHDEMPSALLTRPARTYAAEQAEVERLLAELPPADRARGAMPR
jgi:hypothetical protein